MYFTNEKNSAFLKWLFIISDYWLLRLTLLNVRGRNVLKCAALRTFQTLAEVTDKVFLNLNKIFNITNLLTAFLKSCYILIYFLSSSYSNIMKSPIILKVQDFWILKLLNSKLLLSLYEIHTVTFITAGFYVLFWVFSPIQIGCSWCSPVIIMI